MYEIWSLGHRPFDEYNGREVGNLYTVILYIVEGNVLLSQVCCSLV